MANISLGKLLVVALIFHAVASIELEETHEITHTFCWKDSYGRGVGTIPTECGSRRKIGLLCYDHCPSGYSAFGFDCHQGCPSGWRNDGLFCRNAEYGRGWGYPWKFGDWFSDSGMYSRCQRDHGNGNCEKWGAVVYPKCKSGFHTVGCCICRPSVPNCRALGMNSGIDLSCAKKIIIGTPYSMSCSSDKVYDAGLCYKRCKAGYSGVGPVCWASPPSGWVNCGMGAASTSKVCQDTIISQVQSIGESALAIGTMIATAGGSAGASVAQKTAANAGKIAKLKAKFDALKKTFMSSKKIAKVVEKAKEIKDKVQKVKDKVDEVQEQYEQAQAIISAAKNVADVDTNTMTEADYVRLAAQIAALADPTGIAGVVESYSHPKCSQISR